MSELEEEQSARKARRRAALEQADRLRQELLAKYGAKIIDKNLVGSLNQEREERDDRSSTTSIALSIQVL